MATGGQSSSHPCHNLSNPSKRLFWCRHCMAKFIDPIQRWRHSKTCKKIVSSNPRQEIVSTDGRILQVVAGTTEGSVVVSNLAPPEEPEPSVSKRKIRKLVMNDLKCQICERGFISLDEMREHVKHPCRKAVPFDEHVIPVAGVSITLPDLEPKEQHEEDEDEKASALNSLEANLQQMEQSLAMRSDVADEVVANQIESLLKAAQVLQQQQQQEQQSATYQILGTDDLGNTVDTQYVITTNPDHYEDGEFEAVTVETVATLENIVPQVAMCPEVAQQVVLQQNIEPDDLQLISEVIAREEPEIGKHHSFVPPSSRTPSASSPPPFPVPAAEQTGEATSHYQGTSIDKEPQTSLNNDNIFDSTNSDEVSPSVGEGQTNDPVLPKCIPNSLKKDDSNDAVCSNNEMDSVDNPRPSNCCECCYDPTVDDFGFRNLTDDNDSQTNGPIRSCTCKMKSTSSHSPKSKQSPSTSRPPPKPPKFKVHVTAKKMRTRSTSVEEKKSVPNKTAKKKRKYIGGRGSLDCVARSKRKKLKKTAQSVSGSNTTQTTGTEIHEQKCDQNADSLTTVKDHASVVKKQGVKGQGLVELDGTFSNEGSQNSETNATELKSNVCLPKTVTRKPKPAREPKCRICDRVFKSIQLLQKHNKVPCKIKHTRNLCQKVLRPKRAPVEPLSSLKQKPKQNLTNKKSKTVLRPQLLPVRRISDTTLFTLPKPKKGGKKRRKAAPVFIYSPPTKEYKNTFLGIHMPYKSLPFKEKFFFDLGMISTVHLNKDSCDPRMMDVCESFSPDMETDPLLSSQEIIDVGGPCTPPPILEKMPDLDFFPMHSPSSCPDLEPPVLEVISDLTFQDSSSVVVSTLNSTVRKMTTTTPIMSSLPQTTVEDVPTVLETNSENKTSNIRNSTEATQFRTSLTSITHNEQNDSSKNVKHSNDKSLGNKSPESVQEQMTEIFSKYFTSPEKLTQNQNFKSVQQTELFSRNSTKDSESPNHQEIVSIQNQEQMSDIHTGDLASTEEHVVPSDTDVVKELLPGDDGNVSVCAQACTNSKVNEPQKTAHKSQDSLMVDIHTTLEIEGEPHVRLGTATEQPQEFQVEHFLQEEDSATPNFLLIEDNAMKDSERETTLELPICVGVSTAGDLKQQMAGTTAPCDIHMIVNTEAEIQRSTQPVTHKISVVQVETEVCPQEHLTEIHSKNVQNQVTAASSPSKSSTTRHFTDLLADLCTSQKSEGIATLDTSIWSKAQPLSPHNETHKEGSSSAKTKDSQKLGERHFMDAIMAAALDIGKSNSSTKVNVGSNGLCRNVQKVTVAVQTDAESFTAQMLHSSKNCLSSRTDTSATDHDLLCSDMVGSETFEIMSATGKVEPPGARNLESEKRDNNGNLEAIDHTIEMETDVHPKEDIKIFPNQRELCSATSPMYVQEIQIESYPMQSSSEEGGTKESSPQYVTADHSSPKNLVDSLCPTISQQQPSLKEICSMESPSTKSGSSKESSPQKGEGRNLFESLFSSLGNESDNNDSTSVPLSKNPEAVTYPSPQNNTHCDNEEAVIYSPPKNNTHNNNLQDNSLQNKDISLKENLPHNVHVSQPNSQEVLVYPPPGSKLRVEAPDSPPPQFVGRTASLPLGITRDIPDMKSRTNLLEIVAKSLGIYSDENQDPQNNSSAGKRTEAAVTVESNIATRNTPPEKSSVFVNRPFVQSTSCIGEAEDSSVQIIVMNNQSTSRDYTTDINVIDLPSKPEIITQPTGNSSDLLHPSEQHSSHWDRLHQDTCMSQQTCGTGVGTGAGSTSLSKCSCDAVVEKSVIPPPVVSKFKPVITSQKPGVRVVMCGIEDLTNHDNSCVVVANKSSLQINSSGQSTGSIIGSWHNQETVLQLRENRTSNLCNTLTGHENQEVEERPQHPSDATSGSHVVGQNSLHRASISSSSTSCLTPIINVSSSGAPTVYDIHSTSSVAGLNPNTMVTDIHLSTIGTGNVSEPVAMVTEEGHRPVAMVTGEAIDSDVTMVTNLHSVTSEGVNVCSGSWGEPKVMVQYVQDFDCDQNVSYIVLDNEQGHGSDPFVITESPFLPTGENILCSEEENLLNSNEQPLPAAVMN